MHLLPTRLHEALDRHDWQNVTSLAAVSGGADSVALLRALLAVRTATGGRLLVVHFHHGLRGAAADADATFVETLARQYQLGFILGHATERLADRGDSLEAAARAARYQFFEQTARQQGARYLFTAHTADDQAETILHRILRGTGLDGLAGIPAFRPMSPLTTIVRPLLRVRRAEVLSYLASLDQDFHEDYTNADVSFTRNRLRHDLLPKLATDYNPQVIEALLRLGELAGEAQAYLANDVARLRERVVSESPHELRIATRELASTAAYLVRQLFLDLWQARDWPLQAMTYEKWQELAALARSSADGALNLPGDVRAKKQGEQLTLTRPAKNA